MADDLERPGDDHERHEPEHAQIASIWPFAFAFAVALVLLGLVITSWIIVALGGALALVSAFLWIREATGSMHAAPAPPPPSAAGRKTVAAEEDTAERYPRSVFLEGATLGIGAAIGAMVTLPAIGFALAPSFVDQESEPVNLGPLENFPENQWKIVKFRSEKDQPEDVASRSTFVRYNGAAEDGAASFTLISNRCVHLGCPVQPTGVTKDPEKIEVDKETILMAETAPSGFACPCHGGAYDTEGNRVAGPPVRALDRYEYSIIDGNLVLGQLYSVAEVEGTGADATIVAYAHHDPGQHVDGLEQYFYPYVPGQ